VHAAQLADRMVLNMVTVETAARLAPQHPRTAVWLAAAIDPDADERRWMARGYVGYLGAPGYGEMFDEAGFGDLVALARSGAAPADLAARIPDELLDAVALVGDEATVRDRIAAYERAGVREIGLVVPPLDLPSASRTLRVLRP
jgi:alkanesulfonate monooxygenase SsuD/methylene tetrahydromethanopterin reductase-like flavin-dependent oxidoreductase (luciferase family)